MNTLYNHEKSTVRVTVPNCGIIKSIKFWFYFLCVWWRKIAIISISKGCRMRSISQTLQTNHWILHTHAASEHWIISLYLYGLLIEMNKMNIYRSTQMSKVRLQMDKIKLIVVILYSLRTYFFFLFKIIQWKVLRALTSNIPHVGSDIHFIGLKSGEWTSTLISPFIQSEKMGKFRIFCILTSFQIRFDVKMRCAPWAISPNPCNVPRIFFVAEITSPHFLLQMQMSQSTLCAIIDINTKCSCVQQMCTWFDCEWATVSQSWMTQYLFNYLPFTLFQ